jgi:uncharacterized protein
LSQQQPITFRSGSNELVGTLHLPDRIPAPLVVGCHGLQANRQSPKQIALARRCNDSGIAFFRFDHTGCGDSSGNYYDGTDIKIRRQDLTCAIAALAGHSALKPLLGLFGSSFGGAVIMSYAQQHTVACLVTYAAPITSRGLGNTQSGVPLEIDPLKKTSPPWVFDIREFLPSLSNILVIHAEGDAMVPVSHAHEIYNQAKKPKQLIIQNGGDHPMSDPNLQRQFLSQAMNWYQSVMK